mmetsp:Transcript_95024/g.273528  ORF Transcript_95024/g.273528 Transcript_95024/m.273528 type:complete len:244 (-) Transcript_95024:308-1039(-)
MHDILHALPRQLLPQSLLVSEVQAQVGLELDDLLRAVAERHQNPLIRGVLAPTLAPGDVPCIADHELEIIVVVDGRGDVLVVLRKFLPVDVPVVVDAVELVEEVAEGVLGGEVAGHDVGVVLHVEGRRDVIDFDQAVAGPVQDVKGLVDQLHAPRVERPSGGDEEFINAQLPGAVLVAGLQEQAYVVVGHVQAIAGEALLELLHGYGLVVVAVHDPEGPRQRVDALGAAAGQDELTELAEEDL